MRSSNKTGWLCILNPTPTLPSQFHIEWSNNSSLTLETQKWASGRGWGGSQNSFDWKHDSQHLDCRHFPLAPTTTPPTQAHPGWRSEDLTCLPLLLSPQWARHFVTAVCLAWHLAQSLYSLLWCVYQRGLNRSAMREHSSNNTRHCRRNSEVCRVILTPVLYKQCDHDKDKPWLIVSILTL